MYMDNTSDQVVHSAVELLRYYRSGNATSLKDIFEKSKQYANWESKGFDFWHSNLKHIFELAGLLEVVEMQSSSRWSLVNTFSLLQRKGGPWLIGDRALIKDFAEKIKKPDPVPVITTNEGLCVYGISLSKEQLRTLSLGESFYKDELLKSLPSFVEIQKKVADKVNGPPSFETGLWEKFDFAAGQWTALKSEDSEIAGLFRSVERRYGLSSWIWAGKGESLKVLYPEWLFVIGCARLGIDLTSSFTYKNQTLTIPRQVRLPRLIQKHLFASCKSVHIDWNIQYLGLDEQAYINLVKKIKEIGAFNEKPSRLSI